MGDDAGTALCPGPGCEARVRHVLTEGGLRIALDPTPDPHGTVVRVVTDGKVRARILTGTELPAQTTAWRQHSHRRRVHRCDACGFPLDDWLVEHGHRFHVNCQPPTAAELRAAIETVRSAG